METHIDIWPLMRTLANCNGEGCHSHLPNCPNYADCKVDSDRILEFIEALIEQEQAPMVEALKEAHKFIRNQYWDGSTAHLRIIDSINAVLPKGEGR